MKNLKLLLLTIILPMTGLFAQVPQAMKYQTVIRDASGNPITNSNIGMRLTVHEDGQDVYEETYDINTNVFGLINVHLGQGNTNDNFSNISWTADEYELEVEIDTNGGSNYQFMGMSPLLTVPFAMTAQYAETAQTAIVAQTALDVDDDDSDPTNELQTLSYDSDVLTLSNGNSIQIGGGGTIATEKKAKAWGNINSSGSSNLAANTYNITNIGHPTTGVYVMSFTPGLFSSGTNPSITATIINDLAPGFAIPTFGGSPSQVTIRTYNTSGALTNKSFTFVVFGK